MKDKIMTIGATRLFNAMNQSLQKSQKKIEVASDNLARSTMPNEKTKRLKETHSSFSSLVNPTVTHANHLTRKHENPHQFKIQTVKGDKNQVNISGNSINTQDELRGLNESYTNSYQMLMQHSTWVNRIKSAFEFMK